MDTKALAAFVTKVMDENNYKERQVAKASGGEITPGHVNKIKNGNVTDAGVGTLQALAKGLKIAEDIIFAVARGVPLSGANFAHARIATIDSLYANLPDGDEKRTANAFIEMLERELRRMETKPVRTESKKGKVISLEEARVDNDLKNGRTEKVGKPK